MCLLKLEKRLYEVNLGHFIHKIYLSMLGYGYSTVYFSIFLVSSTLRTKQFCTLISNSMKSIETKSTKIFNSEMLTQVTSLEKGVQPFLFA